MPDETKPTTEVAPVATAKEEGQDQEATLKELSDKFSSLNTEFTTVKKQNSDKDSFISKLKEENKEIRDALQKLSQVGGMNKQKEEASDEVRDFMVGKGYPEEQVIDFLDAVTKKTTSIVDLKLKERLDPIIAQDVDDRIASDKYFDMKFFKEHQEEVLKEYGTLIPGRTPRGIQENLRKACTLVKAELADKERQVRAKQEESDREASIASNAQPGGVGKGMGKSDVDKFLDGIEGATAIPESKDLSRARNRFL